MGRDTRYSEFETAAEAACRYAIGYERRLGERPVRTEASPQQLTALLGESLPEAGEPAVDVVARLISAESGAMPITGPRFFGFVIGGAHPAAITADWIVSTWDQNAGNAIATPVSCVLEDVAAKWALELMDLPPESGVGFVTGGTIANFVGIAAARHALLKREGWDVEANGLFGAPEITVIVGAEAHPTLLLALRLAGFGAQRVTQVEVDAEGRMDAKAFALALKQAKGPVLVCTQAGHIHSGGFDPIAEIAPLCCERGAWIHVDGAFGLWARACPSTRNLSAGLEAADSWAVDCHKMLNSTYDGAFAIVRDKSAIAGAMSLSASYLPQTQGMRDPSMFAPELSRRARGAPIWAAMRALGRTGIVAALEGCCANARRMARALAQTEGVVLMNDVVFNQAAFRFIDPKRPDDGSFGDALTKDVVARVQASGECFVQTAEWKGRTIMRFSVANHTTTEADIDRSAQAILTALEAARAAQR